MVPCAEYRAPAVRLAENAVIARSVLTLALLLEGAGKMPFPPRDPIPSGMECGDPAASTIVAHPVRPEVTMKSVVVGVVARHIAVNVRDVAVVDETSSLPASALEAVSVIPESVMDATVISDVPPPVAGVPHVGAAHRSPVSRRPEQSHLRRQLPGARDPVIGSGVGPVTGRPNVSLSRTGGLRIVRQRRRRLINPRAGPHPGVVIRRLEAHPCDAAAKNKRGGREARGPGERMSSEFDPSKIVHGFLPIHGSRGIKKIPAILKHTRDPV